MTDPEAKLQVWEIYLSVQGESTWAGLPCIFIRLTGCPLRCTYCDTEYAFYGGTRLTVGAVMEEVARLGCPLVEVTGGEPLAQPNCLVLLSELVQQGYTALLETSGAVSVEGVPREVRKILDLKTPTSGEMNRNIYDNIAFLEPHDEVKFVIGSREDYEWAVSQVREFNLPGCCNAVLFSTVFGKLEPATLVEWMLADHLFEVRMQLQSHKYIWDPAAKGV